MNTPLRYIFNLHVSRRALRVALIVGTLLNVINHYDVLLGYPVTTKVIIQIILTFIVPYIVSTHGQIIAITSANK